VAAADTNGIIAGLSYPTKPVRQALLRGQVAYNPKYDQAAYDPVAAARMLDEEGWVVGKGGMRFKGTTPLTFRLYFLDSGEYACAFSMFPTSIEDLMTIADAGGIMPPKSTWFEPKLRDAMFCHMI
jgi:ABC-type transport system substrate-binding protein